jgi:hypothetical protein
VKRGNVRFWRGRVVASRQTPILGLLSNAEEAQGSSTKVLWRTFPRAIVSRGPGFPCNEARTAHPPPWIPMPMILERGDAVG